MHLKIICHYLLSDITSLWDWSHNDGTGPWVLTKRLEKGTFSWPKPGQADSPKLKLTPEAFAMLTDGVDLRGAQMRPWYERE
jgi:transposase